MHLSTLIHCISLLQNLHWLVVAHWMASRAYISNWPPWRIRYCTLASHLTCSNCYNIMNPHGLCDLPLLFNSVFHRPRYNLEFGSRAFRISAPEIWNLLPAGIRYDSGYLTCGKKLTGSQLSIRNSPSPYISSASKNTLFSVSLS